MQPREPIGPDPGWPDAPDPPGVLAMLRTRLEERTLRRNRPEKAGAPSHGEWSVWRQTCVPTQAQRRPPPSNTPRNRSGPRYAGTAWLHLLFPVTTVETYRASAAPPSEETQTWQSV